MSAVAPRRGGPLGLISRDHVSGLLSSAVVDGLIAISCFPARAHGDSSRARRAVWALTLCGRGGARRTFPDWQLLSSAVAMG